MTRPATPDQQDSSKPSYAAPAENDKYTPDQQLADALDKTLWRFATYIKRAMGGRQVGGEQLDHDQAKAAILTTVAECRTATQQQHDYALIRITSQTLELIRAVTPARPEDLTPTQWFALADALKAAGDEIEIGLAKLQPVTPHQPGKAAPEADP